MAFHRSTSLRIRSSPPQPSYLTGYRGVSSTFLRFPSKFVCPLSTKACRNFNNIGVSQIVVAKWSNITGSGLSSAPAAVNEEVLVSEPVREIVSVEPEDMTNLKPSFLKSDGSLTVHAGERLGRGIGMDAITTPVVNTSAFVFKKTADVLDFKEKRVVRHEYGRYGNPTTMVLEKKISALEGAESSLVMASGMCASTVMLLALVPTSGHIVTVIDPSDTRGLEDAVNKHEVSMFFTESPTNPFLRCVDIELVSEICHKRGTRVCIDGTFATPLNQKALALGADLVVHSATKYIGGHNDVLGGCVSGSMELVSEIRNLHHVLGGTLNPNAAYLLIRGIKTMHLRVKQQNSTALRMSQVLEAHPKVGRVYYPGLHSHPEHHRAKKQMTGFGGVVSFEIDGDMETTIKLVDALKIPHIAPKSL